MISKIRYFLLILLVFVTNSLSAQNDVEMADGMRANGKIYVVVAVVVTVFVGLIAYLIFTEKKLSKLEKEVFNK